MKRLVTFGCSHTYGDGLEDCIAYGEDNYITPSKLGWPATLAKLLDLPLLNISDPGASIKEVAYRIANTTLYKDDLIVVLWPSADRYCRIVEDVRFEKILPHCDSPLEKNYYKYLYNEVDSLITDSLFIKSAWYKFKCTKARVIEHFTYDFDRVAFKSHGIVNNRISYYTYPDYGFELTKCKHIGKEGQQAFAHDLYQEIKTGTFPKRQKIK